MEHQQSFLIRSWMDLPHVCDTSRCLAFYFRDCQNCFCLLITSSTFGSSIFLIQGTYHPKRWSLSFALCPASNHLPLDSDALNLALSGRAEVYLHQNVLLSPLCDFFHFYGEIEYLEDLVTFIDAPQLKFLNINFSNQIDFHTLRLAQFINRTAAPRVRDEAYVHFDN